MNFLIKATDIFTVILILFYLKECTNNAFKNIDKKYHLVSQSYQVAKHLFDEGRNNYNTLKNISLLAIDTFLDLVYIMNDEMAKELRTSIIKFYKIKYFHDFTNYAISMEEIIDITEHCLLEPVEKLEQIRSQFHSVVKNFEDVRNFNVVDKCANELPDEVAAAHCVLHQAVLFNETMQDSLVTIVEIKTRQHAQDMNSSIYGVQKCLNDFVPKFFDQLLVDAYTSNCGYLKVVNASIADLMKDKWRSNHTLFPKKWSPLVKLLKDKKFHASELGLMNLDSKNQSTSPNLPNRNNGHQKEMRLKLHKTQRHRLRVRKLVHAKKILSNEQQTERIQGSKIITQASLNIDSTTEKLAVTNSLARQFKNKNKTTKKETEHSNKKQAHKGANFPHLKVIAVPRVIRPNIERIIKTFGRETSKRGNRSHELSNKNRNL